MKNDDHIILDVGKNWKNHQKLSGSAMKSDQYFTDLIKDSCNIYAGIMLIETNIFVAHDCMIS